MALAAGLARVGDLCGQQAEQAANAGLGETLDTVEVFCEVHGAGLQGWYAARCRVWVLSKHKSACSGVPVNFQLLGLLEQRIRACPAGAAS